MKKRLRVLLLRTRFVTRRLAGTAQVWLSRRQFLARAVFFIGIALLLGYAVNVFAADARTRNPSDVAILIGMGAMFGGVLAIVLALSNFMLQRAADLYSAQVYEIYARDWREKLVFLGLASLTVFCFALALVQDTARVPLRASLVVYLSLLMTAAVFCLVDAHYTRITRKINPVSALKFSENLCFRSLKLVHRLASDIAAWLQLGNESLTEEQALAVSYARYLASSLNGVDRQLENILEISLRLFAKGESLAAQQGLAAIRNVIARYFQIRRESFLAFPAVPYWGVLESDSSNFLARNYERINAAGERLMAQHQSQSVVFIMDLYASLVDDAKEIRFINHPGENPILEQLRANFSGLLDVAMRVNDQEVCFRSISVSKAFGAAAVDRRLSAVPLTSTFGDLTKIATWALANRHPVYVEHCTAPIVELITQAVEADVPNLHFAIGEALKNLQSIAFLTHLVASGGLISGMSADFTAGKGYEQLESFLGRLVQRFRSHVEGNEKRRFASDLSQLFEELYSSLRSLAENMKNCDAPLILSVASLMDSVLRHLVGLSEEADKQKDIQRRDKFEKHLSWFTYLPGWFVHYAPSFKSTYSFDSLADVPAKIGLLLMYAEAWPDKAVKCAEAAFSITKDMLEKGTERHGYDEPRQMLSICYMGIFAQSKGGANVVVLNAVVKLIREFEELYRKTYFKDTSVPTGLYVGVHPDQLRVEVLRWREDFVRAQYNGGPPGDESRNLIQQLVNDADVDRFIFDVWGVIPRYSSIEDELKEERQRTRLTTQLLAVLSRLLANREANETQLS